MERVTTQAAVEERVDIEQPRVFLYPPGQLVELPWEMAAEEQELLAPKARMVAIQYFQLLHQPEVVAVVLVQTPQALMVVLAGAQGAIVLVHQVDRQARSLPLFKVMPVVMTAGAAQ